MEMPCSPLELDAKIRERRICDKLVEEVFVAVVRGVFPLARGENRVRVGGRSVGRATTFSACDVGFSMVNLLKENDACRRKYGEAGRKDGRAGRAKGAMGEAMTESGGDARENVRDER